MSNRKYVGGLFVACNILVCTGLGCGLQNRSLPPFIVSGVNVHNTLLDRHIDLIVFVPSDGLVVRGLLKCDSPIVNIYNTLTLSRSLQIVFVSNLCQAYLRYHDIMVSHVSE